MLKLVPQPARSGQPGLRHFSGVLLRADCHALLGIAQITATLVDGDGHQHLVHLVYGHSDLSHRRATEHHADLRAGARYHGCSTLQQVGHGLTRHYGLTALRPARQPRPTFTLETTA